MAFKLLGDMFKSGKFTELSLDKALTNGYIQRVSTDFREILDPMNSYLRTIGTVTYDASHKKFLYEPFKKVDPKDGFGISYKKVPGMSKDLRSKHLDGFDTYLHMSMKQLETLVSSDTIYNVFGYNDAPNKNGDMVTMNRNRENINSSTKILSIDVDNSNVPMAQMHGYLKEFKHIIATTSDVDNKHKFRILLPVSVEVSGENARLYKCIMQNVCQQLLVEFDPTSANTVQPMYGYEGAEVLSNHDGDLFDISEVISDCKNNKEEGLALPEKPTTPAAQKKLVDSMMTNAVQVFDYVISCKKGTGSLSMARASMHMLDSGFTKTQYVQVLNYLNSLWLHPMPEQRIQNIIEQYVHQMREN